MPSYLVSAKEAFVPMELYQPPIEALGETMRIKQQQYDEAFSQISQSVSALENLPVTGEEVRALKQRYLTEASKKLKNISSVDLSIPQNISEANKIFEPYLKDQVLMQNTEKTIFNTQQMKAVEDMQFSKDEKIRDGYHPALKQYLANDREQLEKAGLDPTAYRNFQYRKAIPFINQQKFLEEEAEKAKLKVVYPSDTNGPVLYEVENGKKSFKNYQAWAKSKLNDPRFNEQYMIIGTVQKENEFKELRQNPLYANYTDDQLKAVHADRTVNELETGYKSRKEAIEARNNEIKAAMGSLTRVANPTTQLEADANAQIDAYVQEWNQNRDELSELENTLTKYSKGEKDKTRQFVLENPGAYYASLARNADINNFAAGRASMEQVKVSKNDAYFNSIEIEQKWKEIAQKDQELKMRADGTYDGKGGNGSGSGSGSGEGGKVGGSAATAGVSLGSTSVGTDGAKTAMDLYTNFLRQQHDVHSTAVWDPTNGMMSVVNTLGLPGEQVVAASTAFMKKSRDTKYEMTPEEREASNAVEKALEKATGMNITGPGSFKNALYAYTNKHLEGAGSTRAYTQNDYKLFMAYQNAHKTGKTIEAYAQEEQRVLEGVMAGDKKYSKLVVEDGGKKRMVTAKDIADVAAPSIVWYDAKTKSWKTPTEEIKEQIGENYLNGQGPIIYETRKRGTSSGAVENYVDFSTGHVMINNQKVPVSFVNPEAKTQTIKALSDRFGGTIQLAGLVKDLKSKVVPNEQYFKSMTGQMTPRIGFVFDERATVLQEPAVRIIQELTTAESVGDNYAYDTATNKKIPMEAQDRTNLLNVMKGGEDVIQKYFGPPTYNPYSSKNGMVTFTLKPTITDKELEAAGLTNWKGKDIVFELNNVSTMGPTLKDIRVGQQFYVWKDILDGKPISSPDIIRNGMKFGFKIIPTRSDSSATEAYTEFTFPTWDKETGSYKVETIQTPTYPIKGDGAVDPDTRLNMSYAEISRRIAAITSQNVTKQGVRGSDLLK